MDTESSARAVSPGVSADDVSPSVCSRQGVGQETRPAVASSVPPRLADDVSPSVWSRQAVSLRSLRNPKEKKRKGG